MSRGQTSGPLFLINLLQLPLRSERRDHWPVPEVLSYILQKASLLTHAHTNLGLRGVGAPGLAVFPVRAGI